MKTKVLFLTMALLFTFNSKAQNVITVDNTIGSSAQFDNLQDAIDTASSNDSIYVHASEINYGIITVDKTLHLLGFSHSDPDKSTLIEDVILGENTSSSSFKSLHITDDFIVDNLSTTLTGLVFENNIVVGTMVFNDAGVDNMIIRGNVINYIGGGSGTTESNYTNTIISNNIITNKIYLKYYQSVTIKNNIFFTPGSGSRVPVINYDNANGSVTVQNSIMYHNGSYNMNNTGVIFENCLTYSINGGTPTILSGSNNIDNEDPLFVNAVDGNFDAEIDDYHLQGGSPAIGTGTEGGDIGLYDSSPFEFNNFGFTNGLPKVIITAITNSVAPGGTINVTIESHSN